MRKIKNYIKCKLFRVHEDDFEVLKRTSFFKGKEKNVLLCKCNSCGKLFIRYKHTILDLKDDNIYIFIDLFIGDRDVE